MTARTDTNYALIALLALLVLTGLGVALVILWTAPMCSECGRPLPTDTPWNVTISARAPREIELLGVIGNFADLRAFADAVKPLGVHVAASPMLGHDHA